MSALCRFALILICIVSSPAFAYFQVDLMNSKRSQNMDSVRWTLADWLTQKTQASLMNSWLAAHRQIRTFEFSPYAAHNRYRLMTKDDVAIATSAQDAQVYGVSIFWGLVSLNGEYEKNSVAIESYGGAGGLRLLGLSEQTTSLVARAGSRKRQDLRSGEVWQNTYAEGELQIYIVKFFGLNGRYRHFFPHASQLGRSLQGQDVRGGVFFDFGDLRLFAEVYHEPLQLKKDDAITYETREGYNAGLKIFF